MKRTIGKLFGKLWSEVGARVETEATERKRGPGLACNGLGWARLTCVGKGGMRLAEERTSMEEKKEQGGGRRLVPAGTGAGCQIAGVIHHTR